MNKFTSLLVLIFCCNFAISQTIAGFSAKLKWKELKSEKSSIIYNPEFERYALHVQGILLRMQEKPANIGPKRKNIDLILRANSSISNAYVGLAPFKSEFFLNPPANNFSLGSLPWTYLLSIHEYQHVLQFSNTLYGPTKWAYWFGGELTWGGIVVLTTPNWFFEGDAVRAETEYTQQGRGRIPAFLNGFRQMTYTNSNYTYAKARNGSLKDNVPNHYPLGYLMMKYGREKYGEEFWAIVLKESAQFKGIFYPFSRALKRNSGLNVKHFYLESMEFYKQNLDQSIQQIAYPNYIKATNNEQKANHSFSFLQEDPKTNSKYVSASSFHKPAYIYHIKKDMNREKIHLQGIRQSDYFDVYNGHLLYAARYFQPRWNLEDYSDLVLYHIESKEFKRLTEEKRIFSPNFIQNGDRIVAVEMDTRLKANLVIYDNTGELYQTFNNPEDYYYTYPSEVSDHEVVVGLRDTLGRTNLSIFNIQTQNHELLLPWTFHQIGIPQYSDGFIYFSASFSGIDHIYRVNIQSKEINQLTFGKNSHYQVSLDENNKRMHFQTFDLKGNQIKYIKLDTLETKTYTIKDLSEIVPISYASEKSIIPINSMPESTESESYAKAKHLFNFHSWTLNAIDPEYRFALQSEDILGTFSANIGANYNSNENGFGYFANLTYSQLYPVFSLEFSSMERSALASDRSRYYWNETEIETTVSIPLDYSNRQFTKTFNLSLGHSYTKLSNNDDSPRLFNTNLSSIKGGIAARVKRLKARKNIFTHLGLFTNWKYEVSTNVSDLSQFSLKNSIALPGIFANHNLILDGDFQFKQNRTRYNFTDNFNYARGYDDIFHKDIQRIGINYHFPLFYPDKGAIGLAYLLRTRVNLFFDYSNAESFNINREYNSVGAELIFDLKLFNAFSSSIGFRVSHLLNDYPSQQSISSYELFIPLNRF